jgi:hypothetical protein
LYAGDYKRIGDFFVAIIDPERHTNVLGTCVAPPGGGNNNGVRLLLPVEGVVHYDAVLQASVGAQLFFDGTPEQVDVVLLEPFIKKLTRHLNGQYVIGESYRVDRLKPGFEALIVDVVFDNPQTIVPYLCGNIVFLMNHVVVVYLISK